jgi:hypothetical protein
MKAFLLPVVCSATAIAASPFLPSDGTPSGAIRLAVSVSLVTASIFGTFAAVLLPALIAAREARDRTDYLVATKPVPRWAFFAGRVLGLSAVLGAVFFAAAALSWVFVKYTAARESGRGEGASAEVAEALATRRETPSDWETGAVRWPDSGPEGPFELAPGERAVWRFSLRRPAAGGRGHTGRAALEGAADGLAVTARVHATGEERELRLLPPPADAPVGRPWSFVVPAKMLPRRPGRRWLPEPLEIEIGNRGDRVVRFASNPPVVMAWPGNAGIPPGASYRWEFRLADAGLSDPAFRLRAFREGMEAVKVEVAFAGAPGAGEVRRTAEVGPRGTAVFRVPGEIIPGDGWVIAVLTNTTPADEAGGVGLVIPARTGLVFAPRSGSFAGGLARWALIETAKAFLLIVITCAGAAALSFPIPALLGGAAAAGGYLVSFVTALASSSGGEESAWLVWPLVLFLRGVFPDFARSEISDWVAQGTLVPAGFVLWTLATLVLIRGGLIGLLGTWLARRREVGA